MEANRSAPQPSSLGEQDWGNLPDAEEYSAISGVPGPSTQSSATVTLGAPPTNSIINGEVMDDWTMTRNITSQPSNSDYYAAQLNDLFPAPGGTSNNPSASHQSGLNFEDDGVFGDPPPTTLVGSAREPGRTAHATSRGNGTLHNMRYDVNNSSAINQAPREAQTAPMNIVTPEPVTNQLLSSAQARITVTDAETMRMILRAEEEEAQQRMAIFQVFLRSMEQARAQRAQLIRLWGASIDKRPRMD